jgi:peptidoglycan hydrolase-like protein with peptidoglycan-binding domain
MPASATPAQEQARMRAIDAFHLSLGWQGGFAYNEAAFASGRVYEGRGVRRSGGHTVGLNHEYAVVFPGHGDRTAATPDQIKAVRARLGLHIGNGDMRSNPDVSGHRDHIPPGTKSCPGDLVYPQLVEIRGVTGPGSITPPPPVKPPSTSPILRRGDKGDAVRDWQQNRLVPLGEMEAKDVDGDFGPMTEAATKRVQRRGGVDDDGVVGSETRVAARRLLEQTTETPKDWFTMASKQDLKDAVSELLGHVVVDAREARANSLVAVMEARLTKATAARNELRIEQNKQLLDRLVTGQTVTRDQIAKLDETLSEQLAEIDRACDVDVSDLRFKLEQVKAED